MAPLAQPPQGVSTGPHLDNRRIAAALIDLVVPALIAALAYAAGLSLTRGVLLVAIGWTLYYFFALESDEGQTLGKRVMNLRVVSVDGRPASMEQIAKRTLVRVLDGHVVGLIVMLASGERRQRLGDMLAGTIVTEAEAAPRASAVDVTAPELAPAPASPEAPDSQSVPWHKRSLKMPALSNRSPKSKSSEPKTKRSLSLPSLGKRSQLEDPSPITAAPVHDIEPFTDPEEAHETYDDAPEVWEPESLESYPEPAVAFDDEEPSAEFGELDHGEYDVHDVRHYGDEPDSNENAQPAAIQWHVDHSDDEVEEPATGQGTVKPIEIVSDMDLVMQDAEVRHPDLR